MSPQNIGNEEDTFSVDNFAEEVPSDEGVSQDLTDDEKIKEKERKAEIKIKCEDLKLNIVGKSSTSESTLSIEPDHIKLSESKPKANPTITEIKQFLFYQQRLRFPSPKLS